MKIIFKFIYKWGYYVAWKLFLKRRWLIKKFINDKKAAREGNHEAQCRVAFDYFAGIGTKKAPEKAMYWLRESAHQGYPYAQYKIGMAYFDAYGTEEDMHKAFCWFNKSAEQGLPEAQFALYIMYIYNMHISCTYPHRKLDMTEYCKFPSYTYALGWLKNAKNKGYPITEHRYYKTFPSEFDSPENQDKKLEELAKKIKEVNSLDQIKDANILETRCRTGKTPSSHRNPPLCKKILDTISGIAVFILIILFFNLLDYLGLSFGGMNYWE